MACSFKFYRGVVKIICKMTLLVSLQGKNEHILALYGFNQGSQLKNPWLDLTDSSWNPRSVDVLRFFASLHQIKP